MPPVLSLIDVKVGFGGPVLFEDLSLHLAQGDRVALVGRNGSGKSTLLKVLAGTVRPDGGERVVPPHARVAYLPQVPDLGHFATARDAVLDALPHELAHEPWRVDAALADVGLPADREMATVSGGELRRASLARLVVTDPDVILLDEPTNHLDLPTIEWLEGLLGNHRAALVIVSHDRAFLNRLTRNILWLERGVLHRSDRPFSEFEAWSEQLLEEEAAARHKFDRRIAEELQWSREGISARRTRNMGRLRRLHAMRDERAAQRKRLGNARLVADAGELSGKIVIEARGLRKAFGDRVVVDDFSTRILRGDRVGLVGPNGAGKTTLLKLLIGALEPDRGTLKLGTKLTPVFIDQHRQKLNENDTLKDVLCVKGTDQVMVHGQPKHVAGYLQDFLFQGRDALRKVSGLSGGERARLLLALELKQPSNLLILDEPTNDLDLETLDLLQEVLGEYEGTLIIVSHDRDFLDRLVTSTVLYEGDGQWVEYAGGYTDAQAQRANVARLARQEAKAARPAAAPAAEQAAAKPKAKTKLSYKEQKAYEALPGEIEALEAKIATLEAELTDGNLYARDPAGFVARTQALEAARAEKDEKEERWLELEMLREALAGG
ncbi:MAG: ATP-binding cassette domain-containing protein [Myxococcales bacterium]|nr:ATP-binding cassette domain-containing protein [Myxococcales bacterium]